MAKISNTFWKEVLKASQKLQEAIPLIHPHLFYHLNIFDNELFAVRGEQLKRFDFPFLIDKHAFQVGDYYDMNTIPPRFLSNSELNEKFGKTVNFLNYHRIKTAINTASSILQHNTYIASKSDLGAQKCL